MAVNLVIWTGLFLYLLRARGSHLRDLRKNHEASHPTRSDRPGRLAGFAFTRS
jgi:hypothetical protein